ncbi:bile acid:sodium symporter family protein [Billgrantia antri]|uniref:Bile acid:sodium symporter n=1 Tax=Billgrantia antri TaxID=2846777 RepID=A0ABS6ZLT5_9GAMM|nr:bile acid:sodium symporter family protein [Halomonas antri]MBW6391029.1 bile acid:sodium symporter [Halomonas antri]
MLQRLRLVFDDFTLILLLVVVTATLMPAHGAGVAFFEKLTALAIALLFFMHGAKLSRHAIIAGVVHWRLHLLVFLFTFVAFPLIGWATIPVLEPLLGEALTRGLVYLCVLPGTVQSAIAFTSLARGNVPAAICSASASSLIGILLTPLLMVWILDTQGVGERFSAAEAALKISAQLLLPFVAGHLSRPWLGAWVDRHRTWLGRVDQSSILLIVYTAFSASVVDGLWRMVSLSALVTLSVVCCLLLALVLSSTTWLARSLGFPREDEITIVFCASKKSMATGVPLAQILFSGSALGPALLPLMIFHQIQLMVCAVLASRYARQSQASGIPVS